MANGVMTLWRLKGCLSSTERRCSKGGKKALSFFSEDGISGVRQRGECRSGAETEKLKLGFAEQSSPAVREAQVRCPPVQCAD